MDTQTLLALAALCAPQVPANPFAIGVVGGVLLRQPRHRTEAIATANALQAAGWNFSVGLGQINVGNFNRLGLTTGSAFEPCTNLAALQTVLGECFGRASGEAQTALRRALSCYYSGNFSTGVHHGYVSRVVAATRPQGPTIATPEVP
jgi:type IV secretion system protein VirB1